MKKSVEEKKERNMVVPTHNPLSVEALTYELNKAEEGPFITVQEGMKEFEQWLQSKISQ
jgi:hypothetical protein